VANQVTAEIRRYVANGVSVVPINPQTKQPDFNLLPRVKGDDGKMHAVWSSFAVALPDETWLKKWEDANIQSFASVGGKVSGGREILDFDAERFYHAWRQKVGELTDGLAVQRTGGGGYQVGWRCPEPEKNDKLAWMPDEGQDSGRSIAIETRGEGGYAVMPGSLHPSGNRYEALEGDMGNPPMISQARRDALIEAARRLDEAPKTRQQMQADERRAKTTESKRGNLYGQVSVIAEYNRAHGIEQELEAHGYTSAGGRYARPGRDGGSVTVKDGKSFHHSSNDGLNDGYWHDAFDLFCHYDHDGNESAAVKAAAVELGIHKPTSETRQEKDTQQASKDTDTRPASQTTGFNLTDLGNAERLVARHGDDLRYCHPWGKWLVWDGRRWKIDDTAEVDRRAKETVRSVYAEAAASEDSFRRRDLAHWAAKSEGNSRINAMIALAASEEGIAVAPELLDADPWLFNCQNGTLDLHTGTPRPHSRADLLTKLAPVEYHPDANAPTWAAFLARIMGGKAPMISFIQRAVGHSLTGNTSERVFFVCHGKGANGKTTLLETVQALLGDYATRTPTETLMVKRAGEATNDVARLRGARFVFASEAEEGQRLAVARIKDLTGGDTMAARFLHHEFFEFRPEFKLWLATNHRPSIRDTNTAIWDRLREIPFNIRIEPKDQDKKLPQKLLAELPGILAWAVQGCLAWQRDGLGTPQEVQDATENYRAEMDDLAGWMAECCVIGEDKKATPAAALASYIDHIGDKRMNKNEFAKRLKERGFNQARTMKGRTWEGFELLDYNGLPLLKTEGDTSMTTMSTHVDENDKLETNTTHEGNLAIPPSWSTWSSLNDSNGHGAALGMCTDCQAEPAVRTLGSRLLCPGCHAFHGSLLGAGASSGEAE